MFSSARKIILFDVSEARDYETGDTVLTATDVEQFICTVEEAGIATQQLGQMQNKEISKVFIIDKMYYKNTQPYAYVNSNLYEITTTSPSKLSKDLKLNVVKFYDSEIATAIKEWIDEYL